MLLLKGWPTYSGAIPALIERLIIEAVKAPPAKSAVSS
jgi:hypothetical protein